MKFVAMGDIPALYAERLGRDHLCIVHQDNHLSWGDMATRVNRRASALKRLGIRKDEIVALVLPNENAVFELSFALWKLGATPSSISARLPADELSSEDRRVGIERAGQLRSLWWADYLKKKK